ncbi:MAG: SprT-like domain-containing protein [Verrucomicrobiota bacterium]
MSEESHLVKIGLDSDLTEQIQRVIHDAGGDDFAEEVQVTWNKRLSTTAGRALIRQNLIELNPRLQILPDGQNEDETRRTLLHEAAHLIAVRRHLPSRIAPHGREWQRVCAEIGIPGESASHDLPFPRRRQRRNFAYICPNCNYTVERVRRPKHPVACGLCCKKYNRGKFTEKFLLAEVKLDD